MAVKTVSHRSAGEIPVVILPLAPIETWKAVPCSEVFVSVMGGTLSASSRSAVIGRHTSPRA